MERFPEKILLLIESRDTTQAAAARSVGVDASQFGRWLKKKGKPTAEQVLGLARYFAVPMEYLTDDQIEEPPRSSPGLTDDERAVLRLMKALRLSGDEALRRLSVPASAAADDPGDELPGKARGHLLNG